MERFLKRNIGIFRYLKMELRSCYPLSSEYQTIGETFWSLIIQNNYLENADTNNCQINYLTVANLQNESFAELQEDKDK